MATAEGYFNTVAIFLAILLWVIALNIKRKQICDIYIRVEYHFIYTKGGSKMRIYDDYWLDYMNEEPIPIASKDENNDWDDNIDCDDNIDWDMVNDFYGGDLNDYYNVE